MSGLLISRREMDFLLFEWLDVVRLVERAEFSEHSQETFEAALALYTAIAEHEFAPHAKRCDREPPVLEGEQVRSIPEQHVALRVFAQAGLMAAAQPQELGGMALPYVIERAGMAHLIAANPATIGYAFLTMANANLIIAHGSDDQVRRYIPPMMAGRWTGTMCLSEPHAGSSLADITTRATRQPDGRYRISGNKMWISGGDHDLAENIVHLVLAKIPEAEGKLPSGVGSISLFIVPKFFVGEDGELGPRNDIVAAGLNHKMGYRGTTNCPLNFGEGRYQPEGQPGAIGELIGPEGKGLAVMFHMMNEARVGVGLVAASLGCTGYLHSLVYARNRRQGRPPGTKNSLGPPVRLVDHADVRRMLLAQKVYAEGALALVLFSAFLVDEARTATGEHRDKAKRLLGLLTPVTKSWPSKWCVTANDLAIQVHGGYGYAQDYSVERFYRDNRLNAIHEGTAGIQAIDLLGRKVGPAGNEAIRDLGKRIALTCATTKAQPQLSEFAQALEREWNELEWTTTSLQLIEDASVRLANAGCYLDAFGHIVVAWIWLQEASIAVSRTAGVGTGDSFYMGKLAACRYFFNWELPRVRRWLALLRAPERTPLEMRDEWF